MALLCTSPALLLNLPSMRSCEPFLEMLGRGGQERNFRLGRAQTRCWEANVGSGTGEVLTLNKGKAPEAKDFCSARKTFLIRPGSGSIYFPSDTPSKLLRRNSFVQPSRARRVERNAAERNRQTHASPCPCWELSVGSVTTAAGASHREQGPGPPGETSLRKK